MQVKTIIVLFATQSTYFTLYFDCNNVVRTLGNLPAKFPLYFSILDDVGLEDHSMFRMTGMDGRVGLI